MNSENKKLKGFMPIYFKLTNIKESKINNLKIIPPKYIFRKFLLSFFLANSKVLIPIKTPNNTIIQPKKTLIITFLLLIIRKLSNRGVKLKIKIFRSKENITSYLFLLNLISKQI